jgi:hypothetical protein
VVFSQSFGVALRLVNNYAEHRIFGSLTAAAGINGASIQN